MIEVERLCEEFCGQLRVRQIPSGLAVSTVFSAADGDPIGFYVLEAQPGSYRVRDNGFVLPMLEASGFDYKRGSRAEVMATLLDEYGVDIDDDDRSFVIDHVLACDIPAAAMRFIAFSLRVLDFGLIIESRVASTFREDVRTMLSAAANGRVTIEEGVPISPELSDFTPDFVVRSPSERPVGLFLGNSDARVLEAVIVAMKARHEVHVPCSIIALLERNNSVTAHVRQQASNRVTAVAEFRGDEAGAIDRIIREAVGDVASIH